MRRRVPCAIFSGQPRSGVLAAGRPGFRIMRPEPVSPGFRDGLKKGGFSTKRFLSHLYSGILRRLPPCPMIVSIP